MSPRLTAPLPVLAAALLCALASLVAPTAASAAGWYPLGPAKGAPTGADMGTVMGLAHSNGGGFVAADVLGSRLIAFDAAGNYQGDLVTKEPDRVSMFASILDVASTSDGGYLAVGPYGNEALRFSANGHDVVRIPVADLSFSVAEAPDGTILVGSWDDGVVHRYSSDGTPQPALTTNGSAPGQTEQVTSIRFDPTDGTIWLTDGSRNRVLNFQPDGTFIREFPVNGSWVLAIAADGTLYVGQDSGRVGHFDRDGTLLDELGAPVSSLPAAPGEHAWVTSMIIAGDGSVLVGDGALGTITRFDPDGSVLQRIGTPIPRSNSLRMAMGAVTDGSGGAWVVDGELDGLRHLPAGGGPIQNVSGAFGDANVLSNMHGRMIARDGSGRIWIADSNTSTIRRLQGDGTFTSGFGGSGSNDGEFVTLLDFDVAPDGTVYALDRDTQRVQRFTEGGAHLATWGASGSGDGEFLAPVSMDVDSAGHVWVFDFAASRVQRFTADGAHAQTISIPDVVPGFVAMQYPPRIEVSPDRSRFALTSVECNCVQIRSTSDGAVLTRIDASPDGARHVIGPMSASWEDATTVVVAEFFSNRVSRWRLDEVAPAATLTASSGTGSVTFTASATDSGIGLHATPYSWDGGATWGSGASRTHSGLAPGEAREQQVLVRDRVGNVATVSASGASAAAVTVEEEPPKGTVDTTPPKLPGISTKIPHRFVAGGGAVVRLGGVDPESGVTKYVVTFRGRTLVLTNGVLRFSQLPEGRGVLRIVTTNGAGLQTQYARTVTVDRTAPSLAPGQVVPRFVLGPSLRLRVRDDGATSSVTLRKLKLGANRRAVVLRDAAGNERRVAVRVERRLSLARPGLNRDVAKQLGVRHTPGVNQVVFGFDSPNYSWYQGTSVAPVLVREVQWRLQRWGYLSRAYARTGTMDLATVQAVKRFQRAEGLPVIATVGPRTRAAMDARLLRTR